MDDFSGKCLGHKYPLINAAKDELKGYHVQNLEVTNVLDASSLGKFNWRIIGQILIGFFRVER